MLIVAASLGLGAGVQAAPEVLQPLPATVRMIFGSAITTGGLTALVLNAVLPPRGAPLGTESTG